MGRTSRTLLAMTCVALATGCGGGDGGGGDPGGGAGDASVTQPYPPVAAEPPAGPEPAEAPPGRILRAGPGAEGVAADPRSGRVGVLSERGERGVLSIVDPASGRTVRQIALPGTGRHLEVARPGGPFLVPIETTDELWQVPVDATGDDDERIVKTRVGDFPHDATWLDGSAYTADEYGSTVTQVTDGEAVRRRPVDVQPGGIAAVGDQIALVSVRAYTVELLRSGTLLGGGAQSAGRGPSHVEAGPRGRLYIADTRGRQLIVYDTEPRLKFIERIPLPGAPLGLDADERRGRVWVTLTDRNRAVPIDARTLRPGRAVPTVETPATIAVVPETGRLAIASSTTGELQLVDP